MSKGHLLPPGDDHSYAAVSSTDSPRVEIENDVGR